MLSDFFGSSPFQVGFVLFLTIVVFFGFIREKIPADIVALGAMGALLITGVLGVNEALSVFSNPAPVTIAAMFVLSAALERTGVIDAAGRVIAGLAQRGSPEIAILALMGGVMFLSAFINNTPVVVIFIPVVLALADKIGAAPSKLLIPLSFASIFGGATTLIGTSTNILVDGVSQQAGLAPFGMFEITGAGLILAAVGALYLAAAGRWLLPARETLASLLPDHRRRRFIAQILIPINSDLVGKTIQETKLSPEKGFTVIDVLRRNVSLRDQLQSLRIEGGDRLVLTSPVSEMLALRAAGSAAAGAHELKQSFEPVETSETVTMEGVVGPQSRLVGRRLAGLGLVRLYGVYVIAVHRRGENVADYQPGFRFGVGDTVLLEGPVAGMRRLFDDGMLNNLSQTSERAVRRDKAPIAVAAVALVALLAAFNVMPIAGLTVIAATGVVIFGCLDRDSAYQAIRWDILMLIFGMLALGLAVEKTGAAAALVETAAGAVESFGPLAALAMIYIAASALTEIMSNNATAILLTPIAIALAQHLGVDPRPFVVAVMFAASASFATPIGYQTNTLVYNAGGYRFADFVKFGLPLNILMFAASMVAIPLFWPLTPL